MKEYFLSKWTKQGETFMSINAIDEKDLYDKISEKFPNEEILINGYNFNYITHGSHCLAAGYLRIVDFNITISESKNPAHFNPDFFYVIGTYEKF